MPIYAYRCEACGFAKDVLQKISDAQLTDCPSCGKSSFKKQVTAAGFQLKGTGWYVTDFRGGAGATTAPAVASDGGASAAAAAPAKTDSGNSSAAPAATGTTGTSGGTSGGSGGSSGGTSGGGTPSAT
jgi:putative FmdB family regulatory protein